MDVLRMIVDAPLEQLFTGVGLIVFAVIVAMGTVAMAVNRYV